MQKKEIIFVSGNLHKYNELCAILGKEVRLKMMTFPIEEPDLANLEAVARRKAEQAFAKVRKPVIVEDTGVYFGAYKNFPGGLAKRVYEGIGFDGLIALIKNAKSKKAYFKTAICYKDAKIEKVFSGIMKGRLIEKVVQEEADRLPYEKLFIPEGYKIAVAEMPLKEKHLISHRAIAAGRLGKWLRKK